MSMTFTKLFSSITESTVWCEPSNTRIVWITMLAMADRMGRVWASVPGLANRARVPIEDARRAIDTFLSPDPDSRSPEQEGRRIEVIDGGWRLLNYQKYRDMRDDDERRKQNREAAARHRAKVSQSQPKVSQSQPQSAQAEAEADINTLPCVSGDAPSNSAHDVLPRKMATRKTPPDPNVKRLIDHYHQTYLARFKSPPPIAGGKCGATAKRLLAGRSLDDAKWLITAHLTRAPEMYERKNLYGLEHVLHAAPTLLARRAKEQGECE